MTLEANQPAETPVEEAEVKETPKDIPAPGEPEEVSAGEETQVQPAPAKQAAETTPEPGEDDDGEPKKLPGSQRLKRRLAQVASDYAALAERNAELERRLSAGP